MCDAAHLCQRTRRAFLGGPHRPVHRRTSGWEYGYKACCLNAERPFRRKPIGRSGSYSDKASLLRGESGSRPRTVSRSARPNTMRLHLGCRLCEPGVIATSACCISRSLSRLQIFSPYRLSGTIPACGCQKGTPLAIDTRTFQRFITLSETLFIQAPRFAGWHWRFPPLSGNNFNKRLHVAFHRNTQYAASGRADFGASEAVEGRFPGQAVCRLVVAPRHKT